MGDIQIKNILKYLDSIQVTYQFHGNEEDYVTSFSSLGQYKSKSFTWVKTQKNADAANVTLPIRLAFLQTGITLETENKIITSDSKHAFFSTIEYFYHSQEEKPPVGLGTYLSPQVKLGKNVTIGCNCTLDGDITIGDGTIIENNVVLQNRVAIGENCTIQSGCCIGTDGFGYTEDENNIKTMVKHFGGVVIGNEVLIGANCVVVRGTIDDTEIMEGSKIDTLCHIAHNVHIGKSCACVTNTLLFGSVTLEDNAYIASALIRNQCTVGENALVGMGAIVTHDVPPNTTVIGNPAKSLRRN